MLTLYYRPTCPFCQKVLEAADTMGVEFELADLSEGEAVVQELIEAGGKKQVPFLVDSERSVSMYESDDIIAYISEHYANKNVEGTKPKVHVGGSTCESCEG